MSLTYDVVAMIKKLGRASLDDLTPLFPEKTREQVKHAMHNASLPRRIVVIESGKRSGAKQGSGSRPSFYGLCEGKEAPPPSQPACRPVSFVFDLGQRRP